MTKGKNKSCCEYSKKGDSCCTVAAVVNMDEKGQIVLPKDLRTRTGLKPGDKLAIVTMGKLGTTCCLMLMKANELDNMVKLKIDAVLKGKEDINEGPGD